MRSLALLLVLSMVVGCYVAFYWSEDVADFQAYTRKNLQPGLPGYGDDLAP